MIKIYVITKDIVIKEEVMNLLKAKEDMIEVVGGKSSASDHLAPI